MRATRLLSVTTLVATVLSIGILTPVAGANTSYENSFVAKINAERSARGMNSLVVYWDLVDDARAHSDRMMSEDRLYHNPGLGSVTTGWYALGENVGVGPTVDVLHQAFMDSSGHRANILGDYNYVGVGVSVESETKMWVTVVFMDGPDDLLDPPETTTTTAPATTTTPPPTTTTTAAPAPTPTTTTTAAQAAVKQAPAPTTTTTAPEPEPWEAHAVPAWVVRPI